MANKRSTTILLTALFSIIAVNQCSAMRYTNHMDLDFDPATKATPATPDHYIASTGEVLEPDELIGWRYPYLETGEANQNFHPETNPKILEQLRLNRDPEWESHELFNLSNLNKNFITPDYLAEKGFKTHEVTTKDGKTLRGTIYIPQTKKPRAIIAIGAGFFPGDPNGMKAFIPLIMNHPARQDEFGMYFIAGRSVGTSDGKRILGLPISKAHQSGELHEQDVEAIVDDINTQHPGTPIILIGTCLSARVWDRWVSNLGEKAHEKNIILTIPMDSWADARRLADQSLPRAARKIIANKFIPKEGKGKRKKDAKKTEEAAGVKKPKFVPFTKTTLPLKEKLQIIDNKLIAIAQDLAAELAQNPSTRSDQQIAQTIMSMFKQHVELKDIPQKTATNLAATITQFKIEQAHLAQNIHQAFRQAQPEFQHNYLSLADWKPESERVNDRIAQAPLLQRLKVNIVSALASCLIYGFNAVTADIRRKQQHEREHDLLYPFSPFQKLKASLLNRNANTGLENSEVPKLYIHARHDNIASLDEVKRMVQLSNSRKKVAQLAILGKVAEHANGWNVNPYTSHNIIVGNIFKHLLAFEKARSKND